MRLTDLLRVLPEPPPRIVDWTPGVFALPNIAAIRGIRPGSLQVGDVVVVAVGESGPAYSTARSVEALLDGVARNVHLCVLTGTGAAELPVPFLLDVCDRTGAEVLAAASLPYRWIRAGVLLALGAGGSHVRNELQLQRLTWNGMARQYERARRRGDRGTAPSPESEATRTALEVARKRVDDLERTLRNRQLDVERLEDDLAQSRAEAHALRTSTSFQLGHALALAASHPGRETLALRRRVPQMWRSRGAGTDDVVTLPRPANVVDDSSHPAARLLHSFRQFGATDGRPLIAGLFSRPFIAWCDESLSIVPLLPHDGPEVLERIEPDAFVIQSSATAAGEPWFALGHALGGLLERDVGALLTQCERRGIPTVFWFDSPPSDAPGLRRIGQRCDAVAADPYIQGVPDAPPLIAGVMLGRLRPRPPDVRPEGFPLLHAAINRAAAGDAELALLEAGRIAGLQVVVDPNCRARKEDIIWPSERGMRYSETPWAIASPFSATPPNVPSPVTLALLVSGAAIIGGRGAVPPDLQESMIEVISPGEAADAIERAAASTPDAATCRAALATSWCASRFEDHLLGVLRAIGANPRPLARCGEIEVVAVPHCTDDADALVASLLGQVHPPTRLALGNTGPELTEFVADELLGSAIEVVRRSDADPGVTIEWRPGEDWGPDHVPVLAASARVARQVSDDSEVRDQWWLASEHAVR